MRVSARAAMLVVLGATTLVPIVQAQPAAPSSTPPLLSIYREEVKPGRAPAHAANEAAWSAAYAKSGAPTRWLAMTSLAGPSEAWFLSGHESWEAFEKLDSTMSSTPAFQVDEAKFSSAEGDLLSRTSAILATFRPGLSYQTQVALPQMRYMQVDVVRVKPGHSDEFRETWRSTVAAHEKAKMDEHWAVYEVSAGMPDGTFLFFYPRKSLGEIDKSGPMHGAAAYRDAVGESGRARAREMNVSAVESMQTLIFKFEPQMSILDKNWIDGDPAFWTLKPPPAPAAKKK